MPQSKKKNGKRNLPKTNPPFFELINNALLFLLILFLPTQLGRHWFLDFSYLSGVRIDYLAPTLYLTDCIAILLLIFNFKVIIHSFKNKWWVIVAALLFINITFAFSPMIAIYRVIKFAEVIGLFFVIKNLLQKNRQILMFAGLLTGSAVEFFLSVFQFFTKHSIEGVFYWLGERSFSLSTPDIAKVSWQGVELLRPYGTFSHPNSLAGFYLLIYFFVLLYKPFNKFLIWKYALLLIVALLIFLSLSKYAIFMFVLLNIIYTISHRKEIDCLFCIVSRILIFTVVGSVFFLSHGDVFSLQKRQELIFNSIQIIFSHPVWGVGIGNYLYAQHEFVIRYPYFFLQPVHNIFLLFIAEAGIIVAAIVGWHGWWWIKQHIHNQLFIYCLAVFILTGMFDHYWLTLQQNFLLPAVIFGALTVNSSTDNKA